MLLYVMVLNRELVTRAKLRLVSVFQDIVKDCPKIRYLPKIFLRSFENVAPGPTFPKLLLWKLLRDVVVNPSRLTGGVKITPISV